MVVKKRFKKNYKLILGIIIGVIISGIGVYAETTISSSDISYDNSKSGLKSTDMKGAIDELYTKIQEPGGGKFVAAYTYNEDTKSSSYCMTGEESTCKPTDCYKMSKIIKGGSCKAGDIILYRVNDSSIVKFHNIKFESGSATFEMISHDNIVDSTKWSNSSELSDGAILAREALRLKTQSWTNVISSGGYSTGIETNAIDRFGIPSFVSDSSARTSMVTVRDLISLGCEAYLADSCPKWMTQSKFWTSDWYLGSGAVSGAWAIDNGQLAYRDNTVTMGVRAVVSINPIIDL